MFSANNKPFIDKCILSFSHDRLPSRVGANRMSIRKAQREIASGKKGISHLILRAKDDEIDQLKFLFLIHGIPVMCYALANLIHSSLQEIVVIGSSEVERVLEKFLETVGAQGKSIQFVPEDPHNLSLINTLALGRRRLTVEPNELILFQPGDLPFMYDLEKVLQDGDIQNHNLILWLNSRQKMFPRCEEDPDSEFVQRNYHYRAILEDPHELHDIKEPNTYPINLAEVDPGIMDQLHASRKDGKILRAVFRKMPHLSSRFLRLLPVIAHHALRFRSDWKRFREKDQYRFGMHQKNFNRGASILLNTAFTSKLHDDPSFVSDVDALEDWEDFEALARYAHQRHGEDGLSRVHPYGEELLRFKECAMPDLQRKLPMYNDFPSYINRIYRTLQMGYVPFGNGVDFSIPNTGSHRTENAFHWYSRKCDRLKVQSG